MEAVSRVGQDRIASTYYPVSAVAVQPSEATNGVRVVVQLRDMFGFRRIKEKVYTPGQIDQKWTDEMEKDFSGWLDSHQEKLPVPRETIQEFLKSRTW